MAAAREFWLHADCAMAFEVTVPTPMVFMLRPRSGPDQWVARETYELSPSIQVVEFTDGFGNLCQRLVAPVGHFELRTSVDVMVNDEAVVSDGAFVEVPRVPSQALAYLLPSRYCESDRFGVMASEIVADCEPGYEQVARITQWVGANVRNTPLSSPYPVSATEVNQRREGVCRDLAHVAIALCRALCIPARMVVGFLHGLVPMDIHAWFQAYVGDQWCTFDPSFAYVPGTRIALANGRDAADVAIYNQFGPLLLPSDMRVAVERLADGPPPQP